MDIHKPKPWRGVREFLKEYAIIVVGVLTALGAEQSVAWLHNDRELRETREAIRKEIVKNATFAEITAREDRCLLGVGDRTLDWLKGGPHVTPAAIISPYFVTTVWDASQSGPVSRMPAAEKFAFAEFYDDVRNQQSLVTTERSQDAEIARFFGLEPFTEPEKRSLTGAITAAQAILNTKLMNARRLVEEAARLGEHPEALAPWQKHAIAVECQAAGLPAPQFDKALSPSVPPGVDADPRKSD